jgi:prephenate dehydrogenase
MTSTVLRTATVIGGGPTAAPAVQALSAAGVEVTVLAVEELAVRTPPTADLVIVATAAGTVADVLYEAQARALGRAYTDLAGPVADLRAEAELRGCDLRGYVPGRFAGARWTPAPYATTPEDALAVVTELALLCGGQPATRLSLLS